MNTKQKLAYNSLTEAIPRWTVALQANLPPEKHFKVLAIIAKCRRAKVALLEGHWKLANKLINDARLLGLEVI